MPRITYQTHKFKAETLARIDTVNDIIAEYAAQGFNLTLRQLYYVHVSRGLIANNDKEYKHLGSIVNDARLAGLVDWDAIIDRTRNLSDLAHWLAPVSLVESAAQQFRVDKWRRQRFIPTVMIEKDALVGVIEGVCQTNDVPYFSCRGYTSQSEMWAQAQRLRSYVQRGQIPVILHLGDHDPSGKDMSRDIVDRMEMFGVYLDPVRDDVARTNTFQRLALNYDQVLRYNPPPNPAKLSDSRSQGYVQEFGLESWELDALDPAVLAGLISDAIVSIRDQSRWDQDVARENEGKALLRKASANWDDVADLLADYEDVPDPDEFST